MATEFSTKLELVLKALTLSRGRLASELGVDKSLVGRWAAGSVRPSAHNLSGLTALIANRRPGFTLLDWDRDLEGLAGVFGVDAAALPPPASSPAGAAGAGGMRFLADAMNARETLESGSIYEGLYAWFSMSSTLNNGAPVLMAQILWAADGRLLGRRAMSNLWIDMQVMILRQKLWMTGESTDGRTGMLYEAFNGAGMHRAMVLDGLGIGAAGDRNMTLTAGKMLLLRVADLTGDHAVDMARFEAMSARIGGADRWETAARLLPARFAHVLDNGAGFRRAEGPDHSLRIDQAESVSSSDLELGDDAFPSPELCAYFGFDPA